MIQRFGVTGKELDETGAALRLAEVYYIAGGSTIYVPSTQIKFISIETARPWPDINGEQVLMTPGEAARLALKRAWPDLKKVGWNGKLIKQFDWRPPIYCTSAGKNQYSQVDLSAAYHQIYQHIWLDTPFPLGYGRLSLAGPAAELESWKAARNALVGVCRSRGAVAFRGEKRIELWTKNEFLSPGLWATIQAVLNQIAGVAVAYGAVYINTDGYIWPRDHPGQQAFFEYLTVNGLKFRIVRQGYGDIAGWGCYKVADHETYLYSTGARKYGQVNSIQTTGFDFIAYLSRCRRRNSEGHQSCQEGPQPIDGKSRGDVGRDLAGPRQPVGTPNVGWQARLFDV